MKLSIYAISGGGFKEIAAGPRHTRCQERASLEGTKERDEARSHLGIRIHTACIV